MARLTRAPSPVIAYGTPWVTVVLASAVPLWFLVAAAPILPPLGFMTLLAWRQLRPGLLPLWAGLPLGLADDLVSGQPFGCAMTLWSAAMIALDVIEVRFPWRSFVTDWLVASGFITAWLMLGAVLATNGGPAALPSTLLLIVPQIALSVLCYPVVGRMVGWLDRMRLLRLRNF